MRESFTLGVETHECISRTSFDEQFTEPRTIATPGGVVEFYAATPEKVRSDIPTIHVGGFITGPNLYADTLYDIAKEGTGVFFINPIKGVTHTETDITRKFSETYAIPDVVLQKVAAVEALIDAEGFERIDVVGHSQGALVLAILTVRHPGLVRNLILDCPFGLQPEHTTTQISVAFIHESLRILWQSMKQTARGNFPYTKATMNTFATTANEFRKNTIWRFTHEIPGGVAVDLAPVLEKIKYASKGSDQGTTITLLTAQDDSLFSPEKIETALEVDKELDQPLEDGEGPFKYVDVWAMYANQEANHAAPMLEKSGLIKQLLAQGNP